jgi:hypothetical protein
MSELKVYHCNEWHNECTEFYLKSEADKVIAHQKYKRCLAMANYWGLVSACTHGEIQLKCMRRELKWHKLAEKFKEAK